MASIAPGVSCVDLDFLGHAGVIATGVIEGSGGVALVDPGPSTSLPALEAGLQARGIGLADVRAILITHIHLDHAGATGSLVERCPRARVYVHRRGAPHLVDPSKLLASAGRLYGSDMDRLWGDVLPVPADRVETLDVGEPDAPAQLDLELAGHAIRVAWTPGHAWHHVSYFLPAARLAFVGDTAGLRRPGSLVALPASPPPDVDLEAWRASTDRILAWEPDQIFLTHFGAHRDPAAHFGDFWRRFDAWSRQVRTAVARGLAGRDPAAAAAFMRQVSDELTAEVGAAETEAYRAAGRFDFSYTGLERYWRKRSEVG